MIDRRLAELNPASMQLLALIGHSRQPRWRIGNLVEMAVALGHEDGLAPVVTLLDEGLLFPDLDIDSTQAAESPNAKTKSTAPRAAKKLIRLKSFDRWLGQTTDAGPIAFSPPEITSRAQGQSAAFPECPGAVSLDNPAIHHADGLAWPLCFAALWQKVHALPLRRTQAGLFKRDLDRLRDDPILNAAPTDSLAEIPDPALLAVFLALSERLLLDDAGEIRAGDFPACWEEGLPATLASIWTALLTQESWSPVQGWQPQSPASNPYPSAWLLSLVLLAQLPTGSWTTCESLEKWMTKQHPFSRGTKVAAGLPPFLLGIGYPLNLIEAARKGKEVWLIRLSSMGRWLLGLGQPPAPPAFGQTLLVQPNLEILAYRQGLTPALISRLTKMANWKTLGAACTLQLEPESVYRALESGERFETIHQTLQRHGMKPTPETVTNALRTWSNKRERIRVYTGAALFEFGSAGPGKRLVPRIARATNIRSAGCRRQRSRDRLSPFPSDRDARLCTSPGTLRRSKPRRRDSCD